MKHKLITGTILLTGAGIVTRIIGFVYRIFLAQLLGAKLLGSYQLIFPVYNICFTIFGAGIQTAISQLVASHTGLDSAKANDMSVLKTGLAAALLLSCSLAAGVYFFAEAIAAFFLLEASCAPYLKILMFTFPFCSITCCINGYFYGIRAAKTPAVTQIIEQLSRVSFVVFFSFLFSLTRKNACRLAVWGLVTGEAFSCFYSIGKLCTALLKGTRKKSLPPQKGIALPLLFPACSLTGTKLVLSLLHSAEAVFIPAALKKYGCSAQEALSIYGVLSGITLPFLLFPSAITNSLSVMLLPAIAQAQAQHSKKKIKSCVTLSGTYSLYIGFLFTCLFFLFGKELGVLLFQSTEAGTYIYALSVLCPFLYLSTTFNSIVNGLGRTQVTFFITVASMLVKLYFLIFFVPRYGITAYLAGTVISQITQTLLLALSLKKYLVLPFRKTFAIPLVLLGISGSLLNAAYTLLPAGSVFFSLAALFGACLILCAVYVAGLKASGCIHRQDFL